MSTADLGHVHNPGEQDQFTDESRFDMDMLTGEASAERDLVEMPEKLKGVIDEDAWASGDPDALRKAIVEREKRFDANRRDQTSRLYDEITSLKAQISALAVGPQGGAPSSNGNASAGDDWARLEDGQFNKLYLDAMEARQAAIDNPEDEAAILLARKITPQVMRKFQQEDVRRQSARDLSKFEERLDAKEKRARLESQILGTIASEYGGQQVLQDGNPLKEAAESEYARLKALNGDADAPGLAAAAYEIAHLRANKGQPSATARRDQEIEGRAGRMISRASKVSALQQRGDQLGAAKIALADFLDGGPIYTPPV